MSWWLFIRVRDAIVECLRPKPKPLAKAPSNDFEYSKYRIANRKEVDRILDKVAKYGLRSLTKREKRFLDEEKNI